jgi:two-component system sensor histidine kinase/response regulator
MTANVMSGDKEKVLQAGMNDYISKPINPDVMFVTMAKWITPAQAVVTEPTTTPVSVVLSDESSFSNLPGIDAQAGLKTVRNNVKLYRKLLLKFNDSQQNFKLEFLEAQNENDPDAASRVAHTLKGLAANLGMRDVHRAASSLEMACIQNADNTDELLDVVISKLETLFDSLETLRQEQI